MLEGLLDRTMRRTVVRLAVLAGLLLLFPVAAFVLHNAGLPPPRPSAFTLLGALETGAGTDGDARYVVRLELQSEAGAAWRVEQVFLTLLDGERPVSTLIEDAPALEARHRGAVVVPPGTSRTLGAFAIEAPAGVRGDLLLASARLTEPETGDSATVEAELPLGR